MSLHRTSSAFALLWWRAMRRSTRASRCGRHSRNHGFTLLELMVALVVLATTAITVYSRGGDTVSQLHGMERRTLAGWVAENELNRLRIERLSAETPLRTGTVRQLLRLGERDWELVRSVSQTSHPWLRRVEVEVFRKLHDETVGPIHTSVAFVGQY